MLKYLEFISAVFPTLSLEYAYMKHVFVPTFLQFPKEPTVNVTEPSQVLVCQPPLVSTQLDPS
jgi:hypothetical protein